MDRICSFITSDLDVDYMERDEDLDTWDFVRQKYEASQQVPSQHTGTPYPYKEADLVYLYNGPTDKDILPNSQDPDTTRNYSTMKVVTRYLEDQLDPYKPFSSAEAAAIARLQTISHLQAWDPDIVYKAFRDLDYVFFDGRLDGLSRLRWRTREDIEKEFPNSPNTGTSYATTHTLYKDTEHKITKRQYRFPHVRIDLNSTTIFGPDQDPRRTVYRNMWGTLLHEMVHAFMHITTPGYMHFHRRDGDISHGSHFQRCLWAVNRSAAAKGIDFIGIYEGAWLILPEPEPDPNCLDEDEDKVVVNCGCGHAASKPVQAKPESRPVKSWLDFPQQPRNKQRKLRPATQSVVGIAQ
ncbi:hypothetical protein MMC06_003940, partial [Schaereria dolodes]|nr:hypothetical protein [Schaereria dolodes]